MKRKFYDGQRVRVIGADWTMRAGRLYVWRGVDYFDGRLWWPEYLLESAE